VHACVYVFTHVLIWSQRRAQTRQAQNSEQSRAHESLPVTCAERCGSNLLVAEKGDARLEEFVEVERAIGQKLHASCLAHEPPVDSPKLTRKHVEIEGRCNKHLLLWVVYERAYSHLHTIWALQPSSLHTSPDCDKPQSATHKKAPSARCRRKAMHLGGTHLDHEKLGRFAHFGILCLCFFPHVKRCAGKRGASSKPF